MDCCFLDLLGIPFLLHGRTKKGYDCYGLVIEVEKRLGHTLVDLDTEYSDNRFNDLNDNLYKIIKRSKLEKTDEYKYGNLILFYDRKGRVCHIGVILNHRDFIHCDAEGVRITKIEDYKKKWEMYKWQK